MSSSWLQRGNVSGLPDGDSLEDVFQGMVRDLKLLFEKVSAYERELDHMSLRGRRSKPYNLKKNKEYMDIIKEKSAFLEQLTDTIKKMEQSREIPKTKIHCYLKYVDMLKRRYENTRDNMNTLMADLERTREEYDSVKKQVKTYKQMMEDEDSKKDKLNRLIREAKIDMGKFVRTVLPENMQYEFMSAMAQMSEAFMENEDEENQYVELPTETLQNRGILCMIKSMAIIPSPSNPTKYRLNFAE